MSAAVLGLAVGGITITDAGCVSKSFPEFWDILQRDGLV
jgi:5-enolpyruvylshikimate-3-phosphate synthase